MDANELEIHLRTSYGLTCGSVGWTYQGKGNDAMAQSLSDAEICIELLKGFAISGLCVVATTPPLLVLKMAEGPFCIHTSLGGEGLGKVAAAFAVDLGITSPPEHKGCMLLEKARP